MSLKHSVTLGLVSLSLLGLAALPTHAQTTLIAPGVLEYGDEDQMGAGPYSGGFNPPGFDPKAGATLKGVAAGTFTQGAQSGGHTQFVPQPPPPGTFIGTDQIFVGSTFTPGHSHDGYSSNPGAIKGPAVFTLDYSSLIAPGQTLTSLTLGIAADDFQFLEKSPMGSGAFTASINGVANAALSSKLNNLTLTDPADLFFTFGVDPALLSPTKTLTLSIDEAGDGGDGFGVDFLTVGVTTKAVPEASTTVSLGLLLTLGLGGLMVAARRRKAGVLASVIS